MNIENKLLFKGYIPVGGDDGKRSLEKNWPNRVKDYSYIEHANGIGGVLNQSTILVDIDEETQAEKLLNIVKSENLHCEVRKTNRGYHFYFWNKTKKVRKCATKANTVLGLTVDFKVGTSNAYAVIKQFGKKREIVYSNPIKDSNDNSIGYDELPCYLRLINKEIRDLIDLKEGDGRNDTLFRYIPTLYANKFSAEEIRLTLTMINKYVFAEPLSDEELETVMRETKEMQQFESHSERRFRHYIIGDMLLPEFRRINGKLHVFRDGYYQSDRRVINQKITEDERKILTKRQIDETYQYLDTHAKEIKNEDYRYLIPFKNGNYDIKSETLIPPSNEYCVTYQIPHAFRSEAYSSIADKWLDDISDNNKARRRLLEEVIGVCLCPLNKYQKMFFLYGQGANGKTTFIDVIVKILGEQNCSHISLDKLSDRFNMQAIYEKLANISDETPINIGKAQESIKQLTGNSPISAETKFANDRYNFFNTATLVACGNAIPAFNFSDGGIARRIVLIKFAAVFSAVARIPDMLEKLCDENGIEYLIQCGISGLKRVINAGWKFSEDGAEKIEEILKENDSVYLFVKDYGRRNIRGKSLHAVYSDYTDFCKKGGCTICDQHLLSKRITAYTDMRLRPYTRNGKSIRLFDE